VFNSVEHTSGSTKLFYFIRIANLTIKYYFLFLPFVTVVNPIKSVAVIMTVATTIFDVVT